MFVKSIIFISALVLIMGSISLIEAANVCVSCNNCAADFSAASSSSYTYSNCSVSNSSCIKTSITIPGIYTSITKNCVPSSMCTPQNMGIMGMGFFVHCCDTDKCNDSQRFAEYSKLTILLTIASSMLFKKIYS